MSLWATERADLERAVRTRSDLAGEFEAENSGPGPINALQSVTRDAPAHALSHASTRVEFGAIQAERADPDEDVARRGRGQRALLDAERRGLAWPVQHGRAVSRRHASGVEQLRLRRSARSRACAEFCKPDRELADSSSLQWNDDVANFRVGPLSRGESFRFRTHSHEVRTACPHELCAAPSYRRLRERSASRLASCSR